MRQPYKTTDKEDGLPDLWNIQCSNFKCPTYMNHYQKKMLVRVWNKASKKNRNL